MNRPLVDTSRFRLEFDWTGTWDPSGLIAIPTVIEQLGGLSKGGWAKVMERNKALAIEGRQIICQALKIEAPAPVQMLGSMAALRLPGSDGILRIDVDKVDPLKSLIRARHRIEVSLSPWLSPPGRFLRISAQLYNSLADYTRLAEAVVAELAI